jgi:hypothetical protein
VNTRRTIVPLLVGTAIAPLLSLLLVGVIGELTDRRLPLWAFLLVPTLAFYGWVLVWSLTYRRR